ncbi:nuclear transport factor 2 family protein [Actinomadura sp. ATCC 39365]
MDPSGLRPVDLTRGAIDEITGWQVRMERGRVDVVPPMWFAGHDEARRNFVRWFGEYDGPIALETRELVVAAGVDVAFAHMLHLDSGKRRNGLQTSIWVRSSLGFRRVGGRWLITHEHVSVPIDPRTLQAWLPPEG